jgi:hypothetical protein
MVSVVQYRAYSSVRFGLACWFDIQFRKELGGRFVTGVVKAESGAGVDVVL